MGTDKTESQDNLAKGVDVDANAQAQDTFNRTEAEENTSAGVGAQAKGSVDGVDADDRANVSAYQQVEVGGTAKVTRDSASASGGAFAGYGVKANVGTDLNDGKSGIAASTSMSVGPQIGATGTVSGGIDSDGVIHACVKGEAAAGIGLKGNLCIHVDTRAVDNDGKTVVDYANKAWDDTFGKL